MDFVYIYCPPEQKEQPSMDDLMNQMGGDGTGGIPEGEEAEEMFDDDEVGEGQTPQKI